MTKSVTYKKRFDFHGVSTFSLLGKPIAGNSAPIPFNDRSVRRSTANPDRLRLTFEAGKTPDTIHRFISPDNEEFLFLVKDGGVLSYSQRPFVPWELRLLRNAGRWLAGKLKPDPSATRGPPANMDAELSVRKMTDDELFALANDAGQSILCDLHESLDAVVEYANAFSAQRTAARLRRRRCR